jgi:hypothetical protein
MHNLLSKLMHPIEQPLVAQQQLATLDLYAHPRVLSHLPPLCIPKLLALMPPLNHPNRGKNTREDKHRCVRW